MVKAVGRKVLVAEAMLLVWLARAMIRLLPFRWWRSWLGGPVAPFAEISEIDEESGARAAKCAWAIERAAHHQPSAVCLPQAMALHWMLRRRGLASILNLGSLPLRMTATEIDRLHAWVDHPASSIPPRAEEMYEPVLRLG